MKYFLLLVLCSGCSYQATVEWEWGHGSCEARKLKEDRAEIGKGNVKW